MGNYVGVGRVGLVLAFFLGACSDVPLPAASAAGDAALISSWDAQVQHDLVQMDGGVSDSAQTDVASDTGAAMPDTQTLDDLMPDQASPDMGVDLTSDSGVVVATVSGVVVDSNLIPAPGITVRAATVPPVEVVSDASGQFSLSLPAEQEVDIEFTGLGFETLNWSVYVRDSGLDFSGGNAVRLFESQQINGVYNALGVARDPAAATVIIATGFSSGYAEGGETIALQNGYESAVYIGATAVESGNVFSAGTPGITYMYFLNVAVGSGTSDIIVTPDGSQPLATERCYRFQDTTVSTYRLSAGGVTSTVVACYAAGVPVPPLTIR